MSEKPHFLVKHIVFLICFCFLVLAVSASPFQAEGINGNISPIVLPVQVSVTSTTSLNGPSDPAEVEAFLDGVMPVNLAKYNVPGATVAIVKDGRLIIAKGYGYSDIANSTTVNADTTSFRIGSVSKLFTWTAVMQQVEAGNIDLDADVNTYLRDFKIPDTYPGHPITMRHLMTHTAGFEDQNRHMLVNAVPDLVSNRIYCAKNIPARVNLPGKVSSYSNYGATLAAVVVEDVSGEPFEQYLQSHILTPLSMDRTSIKEDLPPDLASNLSKGYMYSGENIPLRDWIIVVGPAGTISSTAPDMAKFMIAHLQNGTYGNATLLSPATAGLMHAQAFTNDPDVPGMCLGFYEMQYNGLRMIGHGGDTNLFHSELVLLPEKNEGYFISYNSPSGASARSEFFTEFMDHYYPQGPKVLPQPDPSASAGLQKYAGTYESNRHNFARFESYLTLNPKVGPKSQLEIVVNPDNTLGMKSGGPELVEIRPGVFSRLDGIQSALGNVVFHTAADGTVDYLCFGSLPILVFDRVPWYGTSGFVDDVRTASCILLATVFLWPLLFIFRRSHAIPEPSVPKYARIARWIAGTAALVVLAFVVVLLPMLVSDTVLTTSYLNDQAVPAILTALLMLPVIVAILTIATIVLVILAWKEKYWTIPHQLHYTLIAIALIAILWWVNFNNLWPWCL